MSKLGTFLSWLEEAEEEFGFCACAKIPISRTHAKKNCRINDLTVEQNNTARYGVRC